jgi:NAD-dependent deacetylase
VDTSKSGARDPASTPPTNTESAVARRLGVARRVVAITGAGVSAESRIPTYRDKMEGLWASFDFQKLATPEAFEADPETVSRWYDFRRTKCLEAEPNPGHTALARIEREVESRGGRFTLLTQNVDRLHHRAGSRRVVELHGNIIQWRCTKTGRCVADLPVPIPRFPMESDAGGLLRPDVVWFGEALPEDAVTAAYEACGDCDLFLSIGTSAVVYPAAGFIQIARAAGATTVEINRDPTPISGAVDFMLQGLSGEILPRVVELAFGRPP